ncbi:membrane-associated proteins in eicosanoid and glutathione metabolism [Xylona heveae TC161]|uniref:Membrane-associated proteins in eicosanoid and glutathione metabolism n=1 Tax=Xylona heveae (strain CBS 132557 / TC161) TaxID=1328760 RepID=A0A165G0C1_XYLHT|nr:membrane-associated proteins in eicosanoid and glutathione metabolism [Xylona heveae TC161]KZF21591.1 membrane-associated proteins in eicosanoid and glutathione metabolism [Xylona heveae TC161]
MSLTLTVPSDYGFVVLAAASTFFVGLWHGGIVGTFRKAAKVPYPNAYASPEQAAKETAAFQFNCAQRAHGNYLEHQPSVLIALLLSGVFYPRLAALMGGLWSFNRVLYTLGYTRPSWGPDGKGRYKGTAYILCELALYVMTCLAGWKLLNV